MPPAPVTMSPSGLLEPVRTSKQYQVPSTDNICSVYLTTAARHLLSTGTPIEAPPATLWAILDGLFNIRQPTLLQLERSRERKQLPGESVHQFLGSLRDLATKIYAVEERIKIR
ncbi:hypothetical protein X801_02264, partial [Opisthorchis viverrini]